MRKRKNRGISVVEVILAVAIFMTFATGAIVVVLQGLSSNALGSEETAASQFASEGIEAVKSIKNQNFANLASCGVNCTTGTGITKTAGVWVFSGTNNVFTDGKTYTRTIKVEDVQRDASPPNGNIVPTGTPDPDTKKVTSTITWNRKGSQTNTLTLTSYLTDWKKPIVGGGPIMMAYSKTTTTPFYRTWNGTSWSAEASAQVVGGNINYIVLKSSRTRNEAVLGTLDSNGNVYGQVWNGSSWGNLQLMVNLGSTNATTRSFDIAYEKNGDRLVVVYPAGAGNVDFAYRIWNGTSWSAATTITTPPTTAIVRWVDMTQNPISTSNEIAMIMMDNNVDVYGMAWNGTGWGNMGTTITWDQTAAIATEKSIDVAYEQTSGRAMFIWGDSVATDQHYRIWDGTSLTACPSNTCPLLDIPASGGVANWIELVSRPGSNELMYGVLDAGSDLNTRKWSGSAWDTVTQHSEHTGAAENNSSMVFDLIWETHANFSGGSGKAWLVFGNGTAVSAKPWTGSWGAAVTIPSSDDTSFIRLKAVPGTGEVFAGIYESAASASDDIWESRLTGGGATWSAKNTLWAGPISAEPVYFRIDIATP